MTKVINLFGGPGCGKSTTAAGVFYKMKRANLSVELVNEYAKTRVWEESNKTLNDQLYIAAKQNHRLEVLRGKVDWVITDSPLLLGCYYGKKYGNHPDIVVPMIRNLYDTYINHNIFLVRTKLWSNCGRIGSEKGAIEKDRDIRGLLEDDEYDVVEEDEYAVDEILTILGVV